MVLQVACDIVYSSIETQPSRLSCLVQLEFRYRYRQVSSALTNFFQLFEIAMLSLSHFAGCIQKLLMLILISIVVFFILNRKLDTSGGPDDGLVRVVD
jgi:hypothetical protein